MRYQEVKYKMFNEDLNKELWLTTDPKNWDDSEKTLKRSDKTYGVYTELSKNLEFTLEGADFLRLAYLFKDIEARVILEEWRTYPHIDGFYLHSAGHFDFSAYISEENYVKIPFKTGGLNTLVQAQYSEKFELERTEALNGNSLDELEKTTVALTSREILLISSFNSDDYNGDPFVTDPAFLATPDQVVPLNIVANSDQSNIQSAFPIDQVFLNPDPYPYSGAMFYNLNDIEKTVSVKLKYDFEFQGYGGETYKPKIYIFKYNGVANDYVEYYDLINPAGDYFGLRRFTGEVNIDIDLAVDDSLMLVASILGIDAGTSGNQYTYKYHNMELSVSEESIREESNTQALLMHEAGDRLLQILTGEQGRFYSSFYGREDIDYPSTGEYALTGLALGFWIRKFEDEKLEVSLKQYIEASNAIHNTGYSIEKDGDYEVLVVEDMKYFFREAVAITLPEQVSNVKRSAASKMHYSNMSFGYKKPDGDNLYEEAMGLDEYNTQTGYANPITRVDKKYDKRAEFRADSYGKEFARRKPKINYPEEDTRYDKSVFVLDLKTGLGTAYEERVWQDDFAVEPTGVFSPSTATNLRLTPFRNLERHGWLFGSGLYKFQDDYVRYANSIGNSELETQKTDEPARRENADIAINELDSPRFVNTWIEFEHPVDYFLNEQIYGSQTVGDREIPNYYYKVEFINELGKKEHGYLFELKPNGNGSWKLLKAI